MAAFTVPKNTSLIREYRITLPLSVEEYRYGQRYTTIQASKEETGGENGIEIISDDTINVDGQETQKLYYVTDKVPNFIKLLAPNGALEVLEYSRNTYPECQTIYSNSYMKDNFHIAIESKHVDGLSDEANIFGLSNSELSKRAVDRIDLVNDRYNPRYYKESEDMSKFTSTKTGRGPFTGAGWEKRCQPVMTIYKLYRIKFLWSGLQDKAELMITKSVRTILHRFQSQVVCGMDKWLGLTMDEIRKLENDAKEELPKLRYENPTVQGMIEK